MKEKILFLYYKTGGGHLSAARALSDAIEENYPGSAEMFLLDGLHHSQKFERFLLEDLYRISTNYFPPAYKLVYDISTSPLVIEFENNLVVDKTIDRIAEAVQGHGITRIVVLHFLLISPAYAACEKLGIKLPILTIVLDPFTAHPLWYAKKDIPTVVFSARVKQDMLDCGWNEKYISEYPIILHKKYATRLNEAEKDAIKKQLRLDNGKKTILIAGGGEGLPLGDIILRILVKRLNANFIIVCGKSRTLLRESIIIKKLYKNANIRVYGFTQKMYELINIADVVIAKAGPATLMEILGLGKPVVVSNYIKGQEQGNVDFLVQNKLGWFIREPHLICKKIKELLESKGAHAATLDRIESMNLHSGTNEIAKYIFDFEKKIGD